MPDVESALLETDPFAQSHAQQRFAFEQHADAPDTYTVVAGLPDGDPELLLEQWLTAVFLALPDAAIERADVVETDRWNGDPTWAVQITFAVDDSAV